MYNSIKQKYFIQNDLVKMFGNINNLYDFSNERRLEETIYVIDIDSNKIRRRNKTFFYKINFTTNMHQVHKLQMMERVIYILKQQNIIGYEWILTNIKTILQRV